MKRQTRRTNKTVPELTEVLESLILAKQVRVLQTAKENLNNTKTQTDRDKSIQNRAFPSWRNASGVAVRLRIWR